MMRTILVVLFLVALFDASKNDEIQTNRPFIGILDQDLTDGIVNAQWSQEHNFKTYIVASYVKFVEGGGAVPVPIW